MNTISQMRRFAALLVLVAGAAQAAPPAPVTTWFHNDLAGSPVAATNDAGQVIWREGYYPFGERLLGPLTDNRVWFTSRRQDPETGLVYMGARYYDPVAGRFLQPDPVHFVESNVHSFNRYSYANNNPYKYLDPDGHYAIGILLREIARQTGAGFVLGTLADAVSQKAAFGSFDWGLAASSNAAAAGGGAGLLGGLAGGLARAKNAEETYVILDGVRRSKAAELAGQSKIEAEVIGSSGGTRPISIDALRSPKDVIETAGSGARRWDSVLEGAKSGADMPPILVRPGRTGIPIRDVKVD